MSKESLEQGQQWLASLLSLCQMPAIVAGEERSNTLEPGVSNWLTIDTANYDLEQIQALIGTGGSVIDAIQYLANATLNRDQDPEAHTYYIVEVSQYREQRFQKLK